MLPNLTNLLERKSVIKLSSKQVSNINAYVSIALSDVACDWLIDCFDWHHSDSYIFWQEFPIFPLAVGQSLATSLEKLDQKIALLYSSNTERLMSKLGAVDFDRAVEDCYDYTRKGYEYWAERAIDDAKKGSDKVPNLHSLVNLHKDLSGHHFLEAMQRLNGFD